MLEKRKFFVQEKPMDLRVTPAILVLQVTLITPSVSVLEYYLVPREAKEYAKVKYEYESPVKWSKFQPIRKLS